MGKRTIAAEEMHITAGDGNLGMPPEAVLGIKQRSREKESKSYFSVARVSDCGGKTTGKESRSGLWTLQLRQGGY